MNVIVVIIPLVLFALFLAIYVPPLQKAYPRLGRAFKSLPPRMGATLLWVVAIGALGWIAWNYIPWEQIGIHKVPIIVFTPFWQGAYLITGALLLFSFGATIIWKTPMKQVRPALLLIFVVVLSHLTWSISVSTFAKPCEEYDMRQRCNKNREITDSKGTTTKIPRNYLKRETQRYEKTLPDGRTWVRLEANCDKVEYFAQLKPGQKIEIRHIVDSGQEKHNRCSYNVYGDSYPVSEAPANMQTKPELKDDLLAPDIIAHMHMFQVLLGEGGMSLYEPFTKNGGKKVLINSSPGEDMKLFFANNLPKHILKSNLAQDVGHDGSIVVFEGIISDP